MRRLLTLVPLTLLFAVLPGSALAAEPGVHSPNMSYVKNLPYPAKNGGTPNYGTDIEFARIAGRQYAFAGSYKNGMQIVDIQSPAKAKVASVYDCGVTQGDVQVFRQADEPGRLFVAYTRTARSSPTSPTRWRPGRSPSWSSPRDRTTRRCTRAATTSTTRTPI